MSKRRRRSKKSSGAYEPAAQPKPQAERLDSMTTPNHMVSLYAPGTEVAVFGEHRFPRVKIMKADKNCAQSHGLVFVDDRYGLTHSSHIAGNAPATWMDPEVFLGMVLSDEAIKPLAEACIRTHNKLSYRKLEPELDRIFEESYLAYALGQFAVARPYVAEWVLAHYADDVENLSMKEKSQFFRKSRPKVD